MQWRQFTMELDSLETEHVERVFSRHGALSITLSDAADNPVLEPAPGETPLWTDTRITGLFAADADIPSLRADLLDTLGLCELPPNFDEELEDRDWEREWLRDFRPMRFGNRLWVAPRGQSIDAAAAAIVRLDPGLAFGTGTHETTALCLEWLDRAAPLGMRVLDVGCGSGILAIAALVLGAASVDAVDIDPQALTASRQNAADNAVGERLRVSGDLADFPGKYELVLANILSGTLVELADELARRTVHGGHVVLSGILDAQTDDVAEAYADRFRLEPPVLRNGWARIAGRRR